VNGSIGECIRDYIPLSGYYTINGNVISFDLVSSNPDICEGTIKGTGIVINNSVAGPLSVSGCFLHLVQRSISIKSAYKY